MMLGLALLNACGNAGQINGLSLTTAHKSVSFIKEHLPANQRVEFEVAYWALRAQFKTDGDFLKAIDGKTAGDLIASAKAGFIDGKVSGAKEYAAYPNWEQMIAEQTRIRTEQDRGAIDPHDKKGYPRVDYKMHAM
ncbi:hypothetical protein [Methylomonas sp. LL1]|uniref:hypothetical protein n=1 Tax=Methylomonas sp. LL1 TaxID=2785785 RepID=UPI001E4CC986|nr:hypothetical protein [Methylomonas sp. LL1]